MDAATTIDTATVFTLQGVCQAFDMRPVDHAVVAWVNQYPDVVTWASDVAPQLPVAPGPCVDGLAMRRLVGNAGDALGAAVGRMEVLAQVGRVYEVVAYPHMTTAKDPLFPICLAPLSQYYRHALASYVQFLDQFPKRDAPGLAGRDKKRWYAEATGRMWDVVEQLEYEAGDVLAWQELAFLLVVLDYARAAPLGSSAFTGNRWEANVPSGQVALWRTQ